MDERLAGQPRRRFDAALTAGELWTCPPSLFEMLYSARDEVQFSAIAGGAGRPPHPAPTPAELPPPARSPKAELASAPGISHRVKPVDLLIAAVAATNELGVLHYD